MNPNIESLAEEWLAAKAAEKAANQKRLDLEKLMLEHFEPLIEGTQTLGRIKATFKVTRKVDADALMQEWEDNLSENARKCFKWSADVSTKELRSAEDMDKAAFAQAARFITTSPAKPSITVSEE